MSKFASIVAELIHDKISFVAFSKNTTSAVINVEQTYFVLKYSGKLVANECLKLLCSSLSVIHIPPIIEATASLGLRISPNLFLSLSLYTLQSPR